MKPNILFIFADQMRGDTMGCAGHPLVKTPNLDRLAERGVMCSNAFTPDPVCVPARATVTTGNYPHKCTGSKNNEGRIHDDELKIAEYFSQNGYVSYASGKLHYAPYARPDESRLLHGFDHAALAESGRILNLYDPKGEMRGLEDYHDYLKDVGWGGYERAHGIGNNDIHPGASPLPQEHCVDGWVCSQAMDYLDRHREQDGEEKPFFMFMSFPKPHAPYDPPVPFNTMYDPREVSPPFRHNDETERAPGKCEESITHGWDMLSPEAYQVIRAHYLGLISFQDRQIGRMLDYLKEHGLDDNTIIVYSADHGDLIGDFGFFAKSCFYKGSVNVPLLFSFPEQLASGLESDELVGLQDIFPTLASLAGIPLPRAVDGEDLTPLLKGENTSIRDYYVSYCGEDPLQTCMIANKHYKYIYSQLNGVQEFYDLRDDPDEQENRINEAKSQDRIKAMKQELMKWMRENGDTELLDDNGGLKVNSQPSFLENAAFKPGVMGWRWY